MLTEFNRNIKAIIALFVSLAIIATSVGVAVAHHETTWRWKMTDNAVSRVRWNSAFRDGDTRYPTFPSDTRQRLRNSYAQWDDSNIPGSDLSFEEVTSSPAEHDTNPISFRVIRGWSDEPGFADRRMVGIDGRYWVKYGASWLNSDWNWLDREMDREAAKGDVETVQVHEIGHPTGFEHPCEIRPGQNECDASTVMGTIRNGTKRNLTAHDKAAMAAKY